VIALSRFEVAQGKAAQALQRIDASLAQQPGHPALHAIRGDVLLAQRRAAEAVVSYASALELSPGWVQVYRSQAVAFQAVGQPARAIETLRAGLAATKGSDIVATDLGILLERVGRHDEAIEVFDDMLARNAEQQLARNNLAMLLVTYRKDEASVKRAGELVQVFKDSENPAFLDTYGWVMHRLGRHEEAVAALGNAVEKLPNAPELRYHLGAAQLAAGDARSARANLEAAIGSKAEFRGVKDAREALAKLGGRNALHPSDGGEESASSGEPGV
jgi:predicted Zn-dependent protease